MTDMEQHPSGVLRASWPLILIAAVSLIVRFAYFGQPRETVFDEVHFGKFISGYFTHQYFFDIHPPLGKLLISGMGYLGGFKPGFSFAEIGQKFTDNTYLWLRFLPSLAGALLPLVIYLLALELGISRWGALAAGLLVALDNALLTQSRYILLDSFLLLFGFSSWLAYAKARRYTLHVTRYMIFAGALAALALSVKWTGATFLGLIIIWEIWQWLKTRNIKQLIRPLLALIVIPLAIYFGIFAIHLKLLTKTGPGDAFMTPAFQKTLIGNHYATDPAVQPKGFFQRFVELNLEMYHANATLTAGHPYASKWYTWPFMARPIYYWNATLPGNQINHTPAKIYFLGNPVIWWASTVAILYLLLDTLWRLRARSPIPSVYGLVLIVYSCNLLPFIGIKRAMFLYHYLVAYVIAILVLVYLLDKLPQKKKALAALLAASAVAFVYFAPLSYGRPLPEKASDTRLWFASWR